MDIGLINLDVSYFKSSSLFNQYYFQLAGRVTNRDNKGLLIVNPLKSNFTPWKIFCGFYIAQPSKVHIN